MFTIKAYHNQYLRLTQTTMKVVLSITADPDAQLSLMPLALSIALDRSASMTGSKLRAALDGATKVVQALDETITFMVVVFERQAQIIFGPAIGTAYNKQRAVQALHGVHATGGTAMSTALNAVVNELGSDKTRTTKILFLTDGKNEGELRANLDEAVARCSAANIAIHAWGVGTDWDAAELHSLANATHGAADIIPTPREIEAKFADTFKEIQKTALSRVSAIFWSPPGVTITGARQVYPTLNPLRLETDAANPRQRSMQLGSFNLGEQHDYLLDLAVTAKPPGQQYVMVRPSLKYFAAGTGEQEQKADKAAWVYAEWTDIIALTSQIEPNIAHYTHEGDLAQHIEEGQKAFAMGDVKKAEQLLGEALAISKRTGNVAITLLLSDILEEDAGGIVKINPHADAVARKRLEIQAGHTAKTSEE